MSLKLRDGSDAESSEPTPYAVICTNTVAGFSGCNNGGFIYLTKACYDAQMSDPYSGWSCPRCGGSAEWVDSVYDEWLDKQEQEDDREPRYDSGDGVSGGYLSADLIDRDRRLK